MCNAKKTPHVKQKPGFWILEVTLISCVILGVHLSFLNFASPHLLNEVSNVHPTPFRIIVRIKRKEHTLGDFAHHNVKYKYLMLLLKLHFEKLGNWNSKTLNNLPKFHWVIFCLRRLLNFKLLSIYSIHSHFGLETQSVICYFFFYI